MASSEGARADVDAWYESLSPIKVDLVGDFAGKELFAIHGDALMLHCIHDARVDLTDGFQILHAVHAVESFLQKLRERGCNFHIVWFRDQERLCLPGDALPQDLENKHLLIRTILIRHLQRLQAHSPEPTSSQGHDDTVCFEFESFSDDGFDQYLRENTIHFFLCLDAKTFAPFALEEEQASTRLSIARELSTKGYSLAFINGAEFASSKVYCSVVSPHSVWKPLPLLLPTPKEAPNITLDHSHEDVRESVQGWSPWEDGSPLTSRELTAMHALCVMSKAHEVHPREFCDWVTQYIVHLVLLRRLALCHRSFDAASGRGKELSRNNFMSEFAYVCKAILAHAPDEAVWDSFDLLDGKLLGCVDARASMLPEALALEARQFADKVKQMTGVEIWSPRTPPEQAYAPAMVAPAVVAQDNGVLPFSHPVLDKCLQDVHVKSTSVSDQTMLPRIFKELTHWHNARASVDTKQIPRAKTEREMRMDQKFMATYIQYSASLTNATGKTIDPEIIVVGSDNQVQRPATGSKRPELAKVPAAKGNKKAKPKSGKQLALEAAEAVKKGKAGVKANGALTLWEDQRILFEKEPDLVKRYSKVTKYLRGIGDEARSAVEAEISLFACNILASILATVGRSTPLGQGIAALMWSTVQDLNKLGRSVRFPDIPARIDFQLRHCGAFLERSFDPAPDPRVPFHPDAWQRSVLDAVDADKSLFVVAPTSAGKTFISFYAMKKVLKTSDDGVLVYVAPTKALVNQIAAEIQARFSKTYNKLKGRSVWAIHTRDYRVNNPTGCQVLVTVPHILQIMLLAPANAQQPNSWSRRVKRIIFDEVHCIGQEDDGVVWEQLLLLAPCPIIALSATVGNPLEFRAWLENSEKAKGNELTMIVHKTRYSDLRKFLWEPRSVFDFAGLQPVERLPIPGLDDGGHTASRFSYVHPVGSILNRARGTIEDLSLEPRDCISLWESMAKHQTEEYPLDPSLQPERGITCHETTSVGTTGTRQTASVVPGKFIRKADVAEYETKLKTCLQTWMTDRDSPFEAVVKDLRSPYSMSEFSDKDFPKHALSLLTDLRAQGALPAILFQYDRANCEDIAFEILSQLSEAEEQWKASSTEWKRKMAKFEKWKKDGSKVQTMKDKASKAKGKAKPSKGDEEDGDDGRQEEEPNTWASFDPQAPLPMFSLVDETKLSPSEFEATIRPLRWKNIDPKFVQALRRGVGVHHAGMNLKYRQVVEVLFRKGFLTAVVATGTLALGLNMPCKTVVFYGDSVFLTALNYHQAAGRSGRRGFDLLGNVVFTGMSQERVYEIMSSRLPDLRGHFPLSTTLILRTLGLLHQTKNSAYAAQAAQSLLSQTRLYLGGPTGQSIKHHVRFSIEYLRRQHLLGSDGAPLNFAGLVGHLYFTENAGFAFHSLLSQGYFHDLCVNTQPASDETLLEVVLVLSHIFGRFPVGHVSEDWKKTIHRSPSVVLLPPLPDAALKILRGHNHDTLGIFKDYVSTFVDQHLTDKPDRALPFTGFQAGTLNESQPKEIRQLLGDQSLPPTKLRSPFSALSGFRDSFGSIHDLCNTVRGGIFLEESAIPFIPIYPDDTNGPWNAYLYDFYKHGDLTALVRDNRAKRGDIWFHLKDFSLVLATIVTSLRNFMDLEASDDLAMMDVQDAEDAFQQRQNEEAAAGEAGTVDMPAVPEASDKPVAKPQKTTKKAVVESWDDEANEDDDSVASSSSQKASNGIYSPSEGPAWDGDGEHKLPQVLRMFVTIQEEFDRKFRAIWA